MRKKKENLIRIYPGVRPDQKKYLENEAKKLKLGDGEMHRKVIDFYMEHHKQ